MSNTRRARARRHSRQHDPLDFCTRVAWCQSDDDLDLAKKLTHDAVIESLGARRRSGVSWRIATGATAFTLLDRYEQGSGSPERGPIPDYVHALSRVEVGPGGGDEIAEIRER